MERNEAAARLAMERNNAAADHAQERNNAAAFHAMECNNVAADRTLGRVGTFEAIAHDVSGYVKHVVSVIGSILWFNAHNKADKLV